VFLILYISAVQYHLNKGINRKALSDYLRSRTAVGGKFSYRNVAARAGLSHATIGNIVKMNYKKDVNLQTIRAIARGLEEDERLILAVAYGASFDNRELDDELTKSILQDFEKLKPEDREFFRPYLFMLRKELDRRLIDNQAADEEFASLPGDKQVGTQAFPQLEDEADVKKSEESKPSINIVELTERIRKAHPEISFESIVKVLSRETAEVDKQTREIIQTYAGELVSGTDTNRTTGE
jgi:transcriptional regulator with XRE-family HTH domain